jgi:hypothetical protein
MEAFLTLSLALSRSPMGTVAEEDAVEALSDQIESDLMGIGEVVGWDIAEGRALVHISGEDASRLTPIVMAIARTFPWQPGSHLVVSGSGRDQRLDL